jgi:hypothetical protein
VGDNQDGQLGDGTTVRKATPVQIGTGFSRMAAGSVSSYGVKEDGTLWSWGNNSSGQLGLGDTVQRLVPTLVGTFTAVAAGGNSQVLALKADGTLWSWGNNGGGGLGLGDKVNRSTPTLVGGGYQSIAVGDDHSLAIKTDGTLLAWGSSYSGQLGIGLGSISTPQPVSFGPFPGPKAALAGNNTGPASALFLSGAVTPKASDVGNLVNTYVVLIAPGLGLFASDNGTFASLTNPAAVPVHKRVIASNLIQVDVLPFAFDARVLPSGTKVYVGYGASQDEFLGGGQYVEIYSAQ